MDTGPLAAHCGELTPVGHALEQLVTGLDHLIKMVDDGGLDHYDDLALVGFMQGFERFRNRLPVVDHRIIADCEVRHLPEEWAQPSVARVLVSALRISSTEAHRRVKAAEAVGPRVSMTGTPLEPQRPVLAAGSGRATSPPSRFTSSSVHWPRSIGPGSTRRTSPPGRDC